MNITNLVILVIFLIVMGFILIGTAYVSYGLYKSFKGGNGLTDVESVRVTEESNVVRPIELIA